jgi:hypothetical protein
MNDLTETAEVRLEERFRAALGALEELQRRGGPLALVARSVSEAEALRLMFAAQRSTFADLVWKAERVVHELQLFVGHETPLERLLGDFDVPFDEPPSFVGRVLAILRRR